jgi:prepilin-type N-terminal cleavage/methylation domain-containing protein
MVERTDGTGIKVAMKKITDRKSQIANRAAFTLIELLVVISIIGVLAGFTLPVLKMAKAAQYKKVARGELERIETALENYKAKYGAYPPGNGFGNSLASQLYYELSGTYTNAGNFVTLDGSSTIPKNSVNPAFGVGGFVNSGSANQNNNGDDDVKVAKNFLSGLSAKNIGTAQSGGVWITNLVTSVHGPDASYQPVGIQDVNPFRYVYPGTNNPNSYDLWVQLVINGQTNLVCNWSRQVIINSSLP